MVAARPHIDPTAGLACKYDAWNRLVEVDPADPRTFKQQYDGLNRRTVRKMEFMATEAYQHFYYNASWQILEMRPDSSGNPPEDADPYYQYVWSARYIDSPVLRDRNADADGETGDLGKTGSGLEERLYYLTDANFNVTTLVDTSGDAVEHYQYDPYGKLRVFNGAAPDSDGAEWTDDPNNASDVSNVILYTGREYDPETGLYHYRTRPYHAELGRFISQDPIGYRAGDPNLYRYVGNSPVYGVDPTGECGPAPVVLAVLFWFAWDQYAHAPEPQHSKEFFDALDAAKQEENTVETTAIVKHCT